MATTTDAAAAAAAMAQVKVLVDAIVSPVVIATFLSCAFCGIVLSLGISVLSAFPNDRPIFRYGVVLFMVVALLDTGFNAAWCYSYTVSSFMNPAKLAVFPIQFTAYAFIWRVWVVSGQRSYIWSGFKLVLAVACIGLALYIGIRMSSFTLLTDTDKIKNIFYVYLSLVGFNDVLISASMLFFLIIRPLQKGGQWEFVSRSPLTKIVVMSFQTNALSLAVQIVTQVLLMKKAGTLEYVQIGYLESKVYILSVLVTLLSRRSASSDPSSFSASHHNNNSHYGGGGDRSKGFGGTRPGNSVQVHVETLRNVEIDEEMDLAGTGGNRLSHPYSAGGARREGPVAVQFEVDDRASSTMGEKGGY
ncbi:hypothetical protein JCM8547_006666 [Rhodosporidiobolus lusitaniae]